jgi:hypothetical protein
MESGAADGCFSLERYRIWLNSKQDWARPSAAAPEEAGEPASAEPAPVHMALPRRTRTAGKSPGRPEPQADEGVVVIDESADLNSLLKQIEHRKPK